MTIKNLKAGLYTVTFTNPDFETLSAEVEVTASGVRCVKVTGGLCGSTTPPGVNTVGVWGIFGTLKPIVTPPPAKGYLTVTSAPTNASVNVNGTDIGKTPVSRHELTIGAKLVTLRLSGYTPVERSVTIVADQMTEIMVPLTLIPVTEEGYLSVTSVPSGASVSIGGVSIGTTSISAYGLPAGAKVVSISLAGYETVTREITVTAGETTTIDVTLSEAVVPDICRWIDPVGVGGMTREHAIYVLHEHDMQPEYLLASAFNALVPKPSSRISSDQATYSNIVGIYRYSQGAISAGNAQTGCSY